MDPTSLLRGDEVGPWRVVRERGHGSYGIVYRAERAGAANPTPFALKLALHPLDPRFEREAELLARIHHPGVPRLEDRGWWMTPKGVAYPYVVMEWVDGERLYEWLGLRRLTSRQVLRLLAQVARALEATHAAGAVHRDVKGDNILVRRDGSVVLMDFGSGDYRGARTLTHQPRPPGTPLYQSPEAMRFQWEWRASFSSRYEAGPADDVYALGVTAYRLLTGRYPPPAGELIHTEEGTQLVPPSWVPPSTWVTVSPELEALVRQMLSVEPSKRGNATQVARALERAAKRAGRSADQPIGPVGAPAPAVQTRTQTWRPAREEWPWLAMAAGALTGLGLWWAGLRLPVKGPSQETREARDGGAADAGTAGLGESALSTVASVAPPEPVRDGIGLDMPQKPLPGQHRPPCEKHAVEINGGCWGRRGDVKPPCGPRSYEWKNGCYWPIFDPPRPETSGQP